MVDKYHYQDRECTIKSFDVEPSKMKLVSEKISDLIPEKLEFSNFFKLRGQKDSKFRLFGQFFTLKNAKFSRNSKFPNFLEIECGINRWSGSLWEF